MQFLSLIYFLSFLGLSLSFPISFRARNLGLTLRDSADSTTSDASLTSAAPDLADSTAKGLSGNVAAINPFAPKGSTGSATTAKAGSKTGKMPSAASVMSAANAFAGDVATVSNSLNTLPSMTDTKMIKSLATAGYKAESDEDSHRAVLMTAAGSAGSTSNTKIVQNTPTVLTGLQNIMKNPTQATAMKNVATMEKARNTNILPSITQLSNSALSAVGQPATAKKFTPTTGSQ
ncbi:hypothetical protein LSUE1_G007615 [Lachnellula suecica]|uniref:Ppe family protein n=1 Tax=Lachnellula suecica TaxID=602035 RepID=A0A8T9C427_9HELO|nr:hypothetical protein LSUE1_G007615 [Lachnellula suecica]